MLKFFFPKIVFNKDIFNSLLHEAGKRNMSASEIDEMAIPSYLHSNPLVRWIVFKRLQTITNILGNQKKTFSVLDYGCGTGMLNVQFSESDLRYIGVDIITWPAEFVLEKFHRKDYKNFSAENWYKNIADESFDFIVCLEVLEHLDEEELNSLLLMFSQKLKPDGYLVVSGPTESAFYGLMRKLAGFSGEYHHINIDHIRKIIERKFFLPVYTKKLPVSGFFSLFEIIKYRKKME